MKKKLLILQFFLALISISSISIADNQITSVESSLKKLLPNERIRVRYVNNNVALHGEVSSQEVARKAIEIASEYVSEEKEVINMLTVKYGQQVMLKVKFGEISRSQLSDVQATCGHSPKTLTTCLDSLSKKGVFKLYAEPSLVAISGESAQFSSGGEIPLPVTDANGLRTVSYKPYGIRMSFTPKVITAQNVRINVEYEVSEIIKTNSISTAGGQLPTFNKSHAYTTVELAPGESFMIAGIIKDNADLSAKRNGLFSMLSGVMSPQSSYEQKEMVISITPYLVNPASSDNIKLPTDNFEAETELDKLLSKKLGEKDSNKSSFVLD
ncbi:MAG: BON domain-containing protein [Sphingobacteriia bacterium]|nr:BON domain-containing protein [Sphingobacteriia bacterium]